MDIDLGLDQAQKLLNKGIKEVEKYIDDESKVDEILLRTEQKLKEVPVAGELLANLPLMVSMVKAWITKKYTVVSPKVIACLVGAFFYLINKKDLIKDSIPFVGYVDDLAVLGLALNLCQPELKAYAAWRDGTAKEVPQETTKEAAPQEANGEASV